MILTNMEYSVLYLPLSTNLAVQSAKNKIRGNKKKEKRKGKGKCGAVS
jgi:hypothetical protein